MTVTLRRLAYRLAYRMLQVVWWVARPSQLGVKCVLAHGDQVLLVRHTYGPRAWDLPGGMVKRGEAPAHAARREAAEELGIDRGDWVDLGVVSGRMAHRHDTIHIYGLTLPMPDPPLTLDRGELDIARWWDRRELPRPLAVYAAGILAQLPPSAAWSR